jgi:hypothetical protein
MKLFPRNNKKKVMVILAVIVLFIGAFVCCRFKNVKENNMMKMGIARDEARPKRDQVARELHQSTTQCPSDAEVFGEDI